ncbi:MAG: HAD-IIIC family phosphatase [Paludibacteraceae bacterium]|nr:HAD-IIIC family phosphatase [Paludibacteraceae bacterium]
MSKFVFRNNTVERFFGKEYSFSGYDDISLIPQDADIYVWWYQVPIKYDQQVLADEIGDYAQKLNFVLSQIEPTKSFIALTMDILYFVPFTDDDSRLQQSVANYNNALYNAEASYNNVKVIDITEFTRNYTAADLFDWKFYFVSQMGMNPKLNKEFKVWWERKLSSIALKRKKCLVLDLDNTLWGGILGEDGIEGIKIGGDYPGKAFLYWQKALLGLSRSGVILTICSKNNEHDVLEAWENNPFMVLRQEHFAAYRINWTDKATNIKALADELNLGLDSFVFVDDNPTERELVKQMLPMVSVPDFPKQPYELPVFFKSLVEQYFKVYSITDEDKKKTEQYKANAARAKAAASFTDFASFLESLHIQIGVEAANEFNIQRIAQMTQKTNQFNLTTHRYTDADVRRFLDERWKIWCISVADKFGDNGITGTIIVKPLDSERCEIDTFLLSCRILGKGIEIAFIKRILSLLESSGFKTITANFIPTAKNTQVRGFWDKVGFKCISETEDGSRNYELSLTDTDLSIENYYHITIK